MEGHALRLQPRVDLPVRVHDDIPVVARNLAKKVEFALQKHEPLRRGVVDDEKADRVEWRVARRHGKRPPAPPGVVARKNHLVVLPPRRQLIGPRALPAAVRDGRCAQRHHPGKDELPRPERHHKMLRIRRLHLLHLLETPPTRRGVCGVAHPVQLPFDVGGCYRRLLYERKGVDEPVGGDLRQFAKSGREPVGPRGVIYVERRLVDELHRLRIVDRLSVSRVHGIHPLQRPRERGRGKKTARQQNQHAQISNFTLISAGAPGSAERTRRTPASLGLTPKAVGAFRTAR